MAGGRGRVQYGSGRRLATDAQLKLTHDKRAEGITFVDHARTGRENFGQACDRWIDRLAVGRTSKDNYRSILNAHIRPVLGDRTTAQVAGDRDAVVDLLTGRMGHLSYTRRGSGSMMIVGTLDEAVKAGRLARHPQARRIPRRARPVVAVGQVKDLPGGPLSPGNGDRAYRVYNTVLATFQRAAKAAGIPAGFNPHSLRHAYVSALLSRGVPLTDIAPWVGHRDISKLYKVYAE